VDFMVDVVLLDSKMKDITMQWTCTSYGKQRNTNHRTLIRTPAGTVSLVR
jgi:hypothetical protein